MAEHGFRVFVVETYRNRRKDREPEDVQVGSPTAQEIVSLLDELTAKGTIFLDPPPVAEDSEEPAKRPKSATVGDLCIVNDGMVHFTFFQGEVGERPYARHRIEPDQELQEWSAEAGHYTAILFPQAEDGRLFIVSQTLGRKDGVALLLRIIRELSAAKKKAAIAEEKEARKALRDAGETLPARLSHAKLLFDRRQAADNAYLDEIVDDARSAVAEFETRVPSPRNANTDVVQRKLRISLLDENDKEISSVIGRRWTDRRRRGQATTRTEGVSELATLLDEHDLMEPDEAAQYTQAAVALTAKNGARTRIAVDTLREVFTYPVSDGPPSEYQHYLKVAPRVQTIAAEERIELDVIDPLEVDRCLRD